MEPPPAAEPNPKLRLLCSYGGQILPRPHDKTLTYSGGDTRLVSVHRLTTASCLSSLASHLSRTLFDCHVTAFTLKYQLPGDDLDSLISVSTDDDLSNMVHELDRCAPARIRLFLFFPARPKKPGPKLLSGPESDAWFSDALKGVGPPSPPLDFGGARRGAPESIVLETSSSFGSSGSSVSMANSPPIVGVEDAEKRQVLLKLPPLGSVESDNSTPSALSHQYTTIYQDPTSAESKTQYAGVESTGIVHNPTSGFQVLKTVQVGSHQAPNQIQNPQELQYIQEGSHYVPQYTATPSYYPMYYPPLNQHTHTPYQQNHPYPVYYVPMRPNSSVQYNLVDTSATSQLQSQTRMQYNLVDAPTATPLQSQMPTQYNLVDTSEAAPRHSQMPMQYNLVDASIATPVHPQMNTQYNLIDTSAAAPIVPSSVAYKEVIKVPSNQNLQQLVDLSDTDPTNQSVVSSEFEEDFAYTQIYKTQPSGPALISQFQTMTSGGTVLLPEAKQVNVDNTK